MSAIPKGLHKSIRHIRQAKIDARKLSMLTCYDASFAALLNQTDLDMVLIGDSLGNVILGHDHTLAVTLADIMYHTKAVASRLKKPLLVADMPFMSYRLSVEKTLEHAALLMQSGAGAVKVEGAGKVVESVAALVECGIPVMGHLGMTPQSIHQHGGYFVQGKSQQDQEDLYRSALELEQAGAFAVVLELVEGRIAEKISNSLSIPTIGIGSGPSCDGQVLVIYDLLGMDQGFNPKFLKKYADLSSIVTESVQSFTQDVKNGAYPTLDQCHIETY